MHKIKILDISSTIHPMIDIFHIFYIEIKLKYCNETIRQKRREDEGIAKRIKEKQLANKH